MSNKIEGLYCGAGRLISGSLTEKQTKDHQGKPLPEDKQSFYFAVAVPKTDPNVGNILQQLHAMASTHYGQAAMVMQQINMGLAATAFAWKITDGDSPKQNRKTGAMEERGEHYKGCYVFKFSTMYPINCCDTNGNEINPADVKRGYYVDVFFSSSPNGALDHTAGIYLNPNALILVAYAEEIKGGISAQEAFAGRQYQVPAGASATPTSAGATPPTGAGMAPGGGMPQPQQQMGNGMPANTGMPGSDPNAGGGMPMQNNAPQQGGMTASHSDPNVQPHNQILHGPGGGGGMPQQQMGGGGGMPGT